MPESNRPVDALDLRALLYASGELDGLDEAAFEAQLEHDPAAQDALARAVLLVNTLTGQPVRPDPAYRGEVRTRLAASEPWWRRFTRRRLYAGHPAVWGTLGAVAASLMLLALRPTEATPEAAPGPSVEAAAAPATPPAAPETVVADAVPADEDMSGMAEVWADLTNIDHVQKARDEHVRRKTRPVAAAAGEPGRTRVLAPARPPRK
jgi:hypothetical protein